MYILKIVNIKMIKNLDRIIKRMLVKTIIYRIVGATITFLVSYFS